MLIFHWGMNFFNALKSAIDTSSEVYNAIRSSFPLDVGKSADSFEQVAIAEFNLYEGSTADSFGIFISKKPVVNNTPQTFYVIFVEVSLVAFKTRNFDSAKRVRTRLNSLNRLAKNCAAGRLADKFLYLALNHPSWEDLHLACALGLPAYVREACQRGDALSIINSPTRDEGLFPLHLAAEAGFVRLVDVLLDFEADILKIDLRAWNSLHFAVNASDQELGAAVLDLIAKKRPSIFGTALMKLSEDEISPLMLAISKCHLSALHVMLRADKRVLIEHGSRIFASPIDAQCLGLLLEADLEILKCQTEAHNILHRPFCSDVLKVIAQHAPAVLNMRIGNSEFAPLHGACGRSDLDACVALLSYGADLGTPDKAANTPLHIAARMGATQIVQLLLCFGADWQAKNINNQTPLMVAESAEVKRILKSVMYWETTSRADPIKPRSARQARQYSAIAERLAASGDERKNFVRLLALDGGGIRGLILIQTLLEMEKRLGGKVLDHFDWLAGTSTGSILALALTDGTSPCDCMRLYLRLKDEVFSHRNGSRLTNNGGSSSQQQQGPRLRLYSAEKIENFLQKHFGAHRSLAELKGKRVLVTATRANVNPTELVLYRNYGPPSHLDTSDAKTFQDPSRTTIWKAARCSSAAPTYFPSVDGVFMDGGLVANNPSLDLLADVQLYNDSLLMEGKKSREIACVVSLGTGRVPTKSLDGIDVGVVSNDQSTSGGLMQNIAQIYRNLTAIQNLKTILVEQVACSDGHVMERARAWAHSLGTPYFRFTPQLAQEVPLDATDNGILVNMMWLTKCYINEDARDEFNSLISFLQQYQKTA